MNARRQFFLALPVLGSCLFAGTARAGEKPDQSLPWIATGKVTDELGRPIEGAVVCGTAGWGTLSQTGAAETDSQGRYTLRFCRTGLFESMPPGKESVSFVPAIVRASAPGCTERKLNRQGSLMAADGKPPEDVRKKYGQGVFLPHEPQPIDFVLVPAAKIRVHLAGGLDKGFNSISLASGTVPPGHEVAATAMLDRWSQTELHDVPTSWAWRFVAGRAHDGPRSAPFTLPKAREYEVWLKSQDEPLTKQTLLKVDRFEDALGRDVRAQVMANDPFTDDPPTDQRSGHDLLRRIGAASHLWLGEPPEEVRSYSYDLHKADGKKKSYTVTEDTSANANVQHGTSFASPLSYLTKPEAAADLIIRRIEERDGLVRLWYSDVHPRARFNANSGVLDTGLMISMPIRDGVLEVDAKTLTPREQTLFGALGDPAYTETFAQFTRLPDGSYAPLSAHATINGHQFDYRFRVYEPGLWLLDECRRTTKSSPPVKAAWIENVIVNSQPAKERPKAN